MPVDTKRVEYIEHLPRWNKCRDVASGSHAVKDQGQTYLPKPEGKDIRDYDPYLRRAAFYGATGRTVEGLLGAIFRKEPTIEAPKAIEKLLEDVTGDGVPLPAFCKVICAEVIKQGRIGILIDAPKESAVKTHPKFIRYTAAQIINWRAVAKNSELALEQVVLEEKIEDPATDGFGVTIRTQWRELVLENGVYKMKVWRRKADQPANDPMLGGEGQTPIAEYEIEESTPVIRGNPLKYIPFWFIGSDRLSPDPAPIPIEDLVELNLSHFQLSADYNTGLYFAGNPVVWAAGFKKDTIMSIGAGIAWISEDVQAKVGFVEFTGQGLKPLQDALKDTESRMAVLGARLLEEQKKDSEAAATVIMRHSGENSVLKTLALTISQGMSDALTVYSEWSGNAADCKVSINTEFFGSYLDSNQINALVAAWQSGAISHDTLIHNLQKFEVLPDGVTAEEERSLIETQRPEMEPPVKEDPELDPQEE